MVTHNQTQSLSPTFTNFYKNNLSTTTQTISWFPTHQTQSLSPTIAQSQLTIDVLHIDRLQPINSRITSNKKYPSYAQPHYPKSNRWSNSYSTSLNPNWSSIIFIYNSCNCCSWSCIWCCNC